MSEIPILLRVILGVSLVSLLSLWSAIWFQIRQMNKSFAEMHTENMNNYAIAQAIQAETRELLRRSAP